MRERIPSGELSALLRQSWEADPGDYSAALAHSLTWITAHADLKLVGFINVAWDGRSHAFLLDPTVHPAMRRRGIGTALVRHAIDTAREAGIEWVHVDYEPHLREFYERCGFRETHAGLLRLRER